MKKSWFLPMNSIVRYVRKEMGIKQQDLAKMAGVTRQTISAIEKGKYNPSLLLAYKLSVILECSKIEDLFLLQEKHVFKEGELAELKRRYVKNPKKQKEPEEIKENKRQKIKNPQAT